MSSADLAKRRISAFNQHDPSGLAANYAENAVVTDPAYHEPLTGRAAVKRDFAEFFGAFPDLESQVHTMIAEGDVAAIGGEMRGTHRGPLTLPDGQLPATGRRVTMQYAVISREKGDHVVEEHRYYDIAGLLQQLGASG